ncbi:polysaccharide deacetylase family protein [Arenibacter algicola]|uniref:Polysaccharide deacetylase n=1 Tax=Arenibacter algicola TaxID=616991 RepID=A0A221V354_9FLAO|nr:polysaccharide deacetylase family protein [Arenibacter algicola]ASO07980.1 polysaccharide deacetylase [Arenibacter algicola]
MKILTFDIEDWFHILDNASTKTEKEWSNFESRIHKNMGTIFRVLDHTEVRASFFIVGWMAQQYPEIVREIVDRGYEIGSHTHLHQLAYEQNRIEFYQDVDRSIKVLEDVCGKKVKMFRAPGFSITEKNKWAFEILHELGIEIDSSVFPAGRAHGGMPNYGVAKPSILKYNGIQLKEYPINTRKVMGKSLIYSGGGYFRLTPYVLLKNWTRYDDYVMTYLHPRDLDPNQPMINDLTMHRKFKSYVGLKSAECKLKRWLTDFEFIDIASATKKIDWNSVRTIQL